MGSETPTSTKAVSEAIQYSQKRLSRTIEHVLKHWIPINKVLLTKIRSGLSKGVYRNNHQGLIKDIKSDISLYTWCLRELCLTLKKDGEIPEDFDPIRTLEDLEPDEFAELLNVDEAEISGHELEQSDIEQIRVLRNVIMGASAADLITLKTNGDRRAFGASLLRQLGLTLIAWNYPSVFQEAAHKVKEGVELDVVIAEKLGFSPSLLAMKLVQEWGVSERKCLSLGLVMPEEIKDLLRKVEAGEMGDSAKSDQAPEALRGEYLRAVCEFGEKLARSNDNETYPREKDNWGAVEAEVKRILGRTGVSRIREHFEENCVHYAGLLKNMLPTQSTLFDYAKHPVSQKRQELQRKNKYLAQCSHEVGLNLQKIYLMMESSGSVEQEILRALVRDAIPLCGFQGGGVFTFDPTIVKLVPQLQFGEISARKLRAVDYSISLQGADFILEAYQSVDPLIKLERPENATEIYTIAGPLGRIRKLGVLYLELPATKYNYEERELVTHFQAIARTLSDALKA
jgi:hypothetical protein